MTREGKSFFIKRWLQLPMIADPRWHCLPHLHNPQSFGHAPNADSFKGTRAASIYTSAHVLGAECRKWSAHNSVKSLPRDTKSTVGNAKKVTLQKWVTWLGNPPVFRSSDDLIIFLVIRVVTGPSRTQRGHPFPEWDCWSASVLSIFLYGYIFCMYVYIHIHVCVCIFQTSVYIYIYIYR